MFGSSIEYVIRTYTNEYKPVSAEIMPNGSMHSYNKQFHWVSVDDVRKSYDQLHHERSVSTIIYPHNNHHLPEIVDSITPLVSATDKKILVYANDTSMAEINLLFQYHKIVSDRGLSIFFGSVDSLYKQWNPEYTSWQDMQHWELREWFSIFYSGWIQEWTESQHQVDDTFLKISNQDILDHTEESFYKIIDHCNLTPKSGIAEFATKWRTAQQYVIDEYLLIQQVLETTLANEYFSWHSLNLVSEAILQQRLRSRGYEIQCDSLNTFPTDSKTLYKLLEKV